MKRISKGKVIIAGAGPGDPELITLKAVKYLREADVVLTDRLVSEEIINEHVSAFAEIIFVGKEGCRNQHSVTQNEINELLVHYANQDKLVVRLKGGDVAFFSNVLDELTTLIENGISYEIIPGITAASGASAYAGIPLTARNYSKAVRFLTYHPKNEVDKDYWKNLASTQDSLVFYMAGDHWYDLAFQLINAGISESKRLAIVEQATTPCQNIKVFGFSDLKEVKPDHTFVSPSLLIIGEVVQLYDKFSWNKNSESTECYFRPASRVAVEVKKENKLSA